MSNFVQAIPYLLSDEGDKFTPNDEGRGPSKWGITLLSAHEIHPEWTAADIENLDRTGAQQFYLDWAWNRTHIGLINDQEIATKVLNLGANVGLASTVMWLQNAVGVKMDGILGPQTAEAVNSQDPNAVMTAMIAAGKAHYDSEVQEHPHLQQYYNGWMARLNRRYTFA
jgi:lysozyme family protein